MRFGADIVARALLLVTAVGMVWTAVAFFSLAIYTLLDPAVGIAGAAALTGAILTAIVLLAALVYLAFAQPHEPARLTAAQPHASAAGQGIAAALVQLANEHPLLAVGCATLLGVADTIQAENHRERRT